MRIVIIDYGAGNVQSVMFALKRLGFKAKLSSNEEEIRRADKVIFPGVGHAKSAMYQLMEQRLDLLIPQLKQPVLGVCLGMQLMCNFSEEGETKCLGIFDLDVLKFKEGNKIPKIGWNNISDLKTPLFNKVEEGEFMYFVHSYYVPLAKETIAQADYGCFYSSAINKNNFYGCQFHPEKSGDAGEQILKNFLEL
jgi:imidazole glycerol-phosphate synthase subunit HisH